MKKILIAVDDSKYSDHAAELGFDIARCYNAEVGLVNIVEPMVLPVTSTDTLAGVPFESTPMADPELIRAQRESSENIIDRTIQKFGGDMQITQFTDYGPTSDGILSCCNEFKADMIVLGTHSRTGLDRLVMGSIAEKVIRHASVPVLVVPLKQA
jgi:nucleotide-binding universal stress UspA family protein